MKYKLLKQLAIESNDIHELAIIKNRIKEEHAIRCYSSIIINILSIILHGLAIFIRINALECSTNISANAITIFATITTIIAGCLYILSIPYLNLIEKVDNRRKFLEIKEAHDYDWVNFN